MLPVDQFYLERVEGVEVRAALGECDDDAGPRAVVVQIHTGPLFVSGVYLVPPTGRVDQEVPISAVLGRSRQAS